MSSTQPPKKTARRRRVGQPVTPKKCTSQLRGAALSTIEQRARLACSLVPTRSQRECMHPDLFYSQGQSKFLKYNASFKASFRNPLDAGLLPNSENGFLMPGFVDFDVNYVDRIPVTAAAGAIGNQNFALNGCYDPDVTGTGHQPLWWDQISPFFKWYTVHSCEATFMLIDNAASSAAAQIEIAVCPALNANPSTYDPSVVGEQNGGYWQLCNTSSGSGVLSNSFRVKYDIADLWGVSRETLCVGSFYGGSTSSNPTSVQYLNVCWRAVDQSTTLSTVYMYVELKYRVRMFGRNPAAIS